MHTFVYYRYTLEAHVGHLFIHTTTDHWHLSIIPIYYYIGADLHRISTSHGIKRAELSCACLAAVAAPVIGKRPAEEAGPSFGSIRGPVSQSAVLEELENITDCVPFAYMQGHPLWWAADIKNRRTDRVTGPWMLGQLISIGRHPDLDEKDVVKGVLEAVARVVESGGDDNSVRAFVGHCGRNRQTNLLTEMLLEPYYARPLLRIFSSLVNTDDEESLGSPSLVLSYALGLWEAVESETRELDIVVQAVRLVAELCDGDDETGSLVVSVSTVHRDGVA